MHNGFDEVGEAKRMNRAEESLLFYYLPKKKKLIVSSQLFGYVKDECIEIQILTYNFRFITFIKYVALFVF